MINQGVNHVIQRFLLRVDVILISIFGLNLFIRLIPLLTGYQVPHGWIDTSYHISTALDVRDGYYESLIHPWWHFPNVVYIDGNEVIDRYSNSFLYPPLLHLLLAGAMFLTHPGVATIITISILYSLSTIAVFLWLKSYQLGDSVALTTSFLVGLSSPLIYSQNYGFWSFTIALIFTVFSHSLLKFYLSRGGVKLLILSVFFGCLAVLTHWVFGFVILLLTLIAYTMLRSREIIKFTVLFIVFMLPFAVVFLMFSNVFSYQFTYEASFFHENILFYFLAFLSWILALGRGRIHVLTLLVLIPILSYYIMDFRFPLVDMFQFTLPFILAPYIGCLYQRLTGYSKYLYLALLIVLVSLSFLQVVSIQLSAKPDLTNKQFNDLLALRSQFTPANNTIIAINERYAPWITLVSKSSKILNPYSSTFNISCLKGFQIYSIKLVNESFVLVRIGCEEQYTS